MQKNEQICKHGNCTCTLTFSEESGAQTCKANKCNLRYSGNNSFQRCNGEVKRCKVEYNKGDCDTKSVISITTEKTTAIKCQFEGMNDNVRNFEFSFKINNVLVISFFFFSPQGFSRDGFYVDPPESNSENTVCRCNHLTHFSLWADFSCGQRYFLLLLYFAFRS